MSKIRIEDNFGEKLTLKKYIRKRGEELAENFISRKKLIELNVLNSNQIEGFVKSGKLHKVHYKNLVYFDKKEIQILQNLKKIWKLKIYGKIGITIQ